VGADVSTTSAFPYKLDIDKLMLNVRRYVVSPDILAHHQKILSSGKTLNYPMRSLQANTFAISTGTQSVQSETLFRGTLPEFFILTFVDSSAVHGSITKSPFNFQSFKVNRIEVSVDGDASVYRTLDINENDSMTLMAFNSLASALPDNLDHGIDRDSFMNGNFMTVFQIMPFSVAGNFQAARLGNIKVQISFGKPLEKNVNCIVVGQFQNLMKIDGHRNVTIETL
jgi:hypothetical protein